MVKRATLLKNGVAELYCLIDERQHSGYFYVTTDYETQSFRFLNDALPYYELATNALRDKALRLLEERGQRKTDIVQGPMR